MKKKNTKPRVKKKNAHGKQDTKPIVWTRETVAKEVASLFLDVKKKNDFVFIGELFIDRDYPREYISRWAIEYKDDEEISHTIKKINQILEARSAKRALTGQYNANFTKFHLINNHDWKDKTEVKGDVNLGGLADIFDKATARRNGEEGT